MTLALLIAALGVVLLRRDDDSRVAAGTSSPSPSAPRPSDGPTSAKARPAAEPSLRAPCDREPAVTAVGSATSGAAANVRLAFRASCPGGQYVDGDAVHVALRHQDGQVLGDAVYDFSSAPLWLPGDRPVETTLTFQGKSVQVPPLEIEDSIARNDVVAQCEESADSGSAEQQAPSAAEPDVEATYTPEAPSHSDEDEQSSLALLQQTAAEDRPAVATDLEGWWVPQLSSKALGTPVDGRGFAYLDIYDEHSRLRDTYPNVRLLYSGDWKAFANTGFWVTVAGLRFAEPSAANTWCDQQGFSVDDCLAKRILLDGPPEHTTVTRK